MRQIITPTEPISQVIFIHDYSNLYFKMKPTVSITRQNLFKMQLYFIKENQDSVILLLASSDRE